MAQWDELAEQDYLGATVATCRLRKQGGRKTATLALAHIELVPRGRLRFFRGKPQAHGPFELSYPLQRERQLWTVATAIQFFRDFESAGNANLQKVGDYEQATILPQWPTLAVDKVGFDAQLGAVALPNTFRIRDMVAPLLDGAPDRQAFILRELGLPLWQEPWRTLLGGARLVAPNPLWSEIVIRSCGERSGRHIRYIDLTLRPGVKRGVLESLQVVLASRGAIGWTHIESREVADLPMRIEAPTSELGIAVICRKRGLLFASEPHSFLESIGLSVGISSGISLQYKVPATSSRRPEELITVNPISNWHNTEIGSRRSPPDASLRRAATLHRQLRSEEKEFWFEAGEVKRATDQVRELTKRATREVLFVDPYFNALDFARFALGIGSPQIRVRVLTSKEAFAGKGNEGRAKFVSTIEDVLTMRRAQRLSIEVKEMAETEIHDRFLGVDSELWLVGSSFNDLGGRGTMIVRLRTERRTMLSLEAAWLRARSIRDALGAGQDVRDQE